MKITRRTTLGLLGAGASLPQAAMAQRAIVDATFAHGVASGDPTIAGAILWTRVSPGDPAQTSAVPVRWYVAERENGSPVEQGRTEARPARDFTVKVEPRRLHPGREYHFWFEAGGARSPVGRFRTLPQGATVNAVLAVVSCQLYAGGLFNAYDAIARLPRLDAVVHLGDYIYEYASKDYGRETAERLGRIPLPPHETVTLADYRTRHAHYKTDPDLQAAHARAAFICVWDDHETTNDSFREGAQNHQPETEGSWRQRKAAAMQAYFEWMPIRDPKPGDPWEAINRAFQFGDLATLLMVETRLLARSKQAEFKGEAPNASELAAVLAEHRRPDRELLGEPQRRWVQRELAASVGARKPWQVIGNQVVMARVAGPQIDRILGAERAAALLGSLDLALAKRVQAIQAGYRAGLPYNTDAWDGYPAARERLYASFRAAGSRPLVLAGDSHAFWANDLFDDGKRLVGAEFGTSSITSPSVGDALGELPLGKLLEAANEEVVFCDQKAKGYILLSLDRERARADYVAVSTILAKPFQTRTLASFEVRAAAPDQRLRHIG